MENIIRSNIRKSEDELTSKIGMRVSLNNNKDNSGTLIIKYKSTDQLDRLINTIKNNY